MAGLTNHPFLRLSSHMSQCCFKEGANSDLAHLLPNRSSDLTKNKNFEWFCWKSSVHLYPTASQFTYVFCPSSSPNGTFVCRQFFAFLTHSLDGFIHLSWNLHCDHETDLPVSNLDLCFASQPCISNYECLCCVRSYWSKTELVIIFRLSPIPTCSSFYLKQSHSSVNHMTNLGALLLTHFSIRPVFVEDSLCVRFYVKSWQHRPGGYPRVSRSDSSSLITSFGYSFSYSYTPHDSTCPTWDSCSFSCESPIFGLFFSHPLDM